jgi:Short C-terminal domain
MTAPSAGRPRNAHPIVVWMLVVAASLLMLVSILTTWVNRQMLDSSSWQQASADLIDDPAVQDALSIYLVNQLYANVDVEAELQQQLPGNTKKLAGPVSAALRQPATNAVGFLLGTPRFQQLFVNASSVGQQKLVNVLENKTGYGISTGKGVVTVDLSELVQQLGTELGLPGKALANLPPNAGVITVMRSDQLSAAQTGVRVIHVLSVWLLVLVLALYGIAIYLARGGRRETLRNIGWAFILVGLVTLIVRRAVGSYALDALTTATYRSAANHVWLIGSEILGQIGRAVVLYGIFIVLGALLAGPTRAAVSVRGAVAPTLVRRPGLTWSVVGGAFLLLVLWGGTHALRTWWGVLLLAALIAVGVEALRRQAAGELAALPAGAAAGGGMAASVRSFAGRVREPQPEAGNGAAAPVPAASTADEIARLSELHDRGAITDEEFTLAKQRLLA